MKKKNRTKLGEQIGFNFLKDPSDGYMDGIEDIFGPAEEYEGNREEEITQSKEYRITKRGKEYLKKHKKGG